MDIEHRLSALEADTAVLKAIMPRIEEKLDEHMKETKTSREGTNGKLDALTAAIAARENQAKGFAYGWEMLRSLIVFGAGAGVLKWFSFIR